MQFRGKSTEVDDAVEGTVFHWAGKEIQSIGSGSLADISNLELNLETNRGSLSQNCTTDGDVVVYQHSCLFQGAFQVILLVECESK